MEFKLFVPYEDQRGGEGEIGVGSMVFRRYGFLERGIGEITECIFEYVYRFYV